MVRQTIIPTGNTYTLQLNIPDSMVGKKISVFYGEEEPATDSAFFSTTGTRNELDAFYDSVNLNFANFTFNRDEANER